MQVNSTMFVADALRGNLVKRGMLDSKELMSELCRLKQQNITTNADLARLLQIPTSRVAEIFSGKRAIKIDEMKVIVERFGLESATARPFNADNLEPLIDALLPIAPPPSRMTDQSRRALAEAFAYGLGMLGASPTSQASGDVVETAARASVTRFRELMN
jgi:predicted XRE-type DNA-binding protein